MKIFSPVIGDVPGLIATDNVLVLSTICFPRLSNCSISAPYSDKAPSIL